MKRFMIGLVLFGCIAGAASAHRMDLDCYAEGNEIVIEAWTGRDDVVVGGEVAITAEDGTILIQGKTDDQGRFRWKPGAVQSISISVYAGEGHKKSLDISQEDLSALLAEANAAPPAPEAAEGEPVQGEVKIESKPAGRSSKSISTQNAFGTPERVVIGLTFISAFAAVWMANRNSKKLDRIIESLNKHESGN
ncbi:MAG: hypothetical protein JXR73_04690 [Candidatus Omnitrophica bacterium]|nr:hypothetical protein [Candidatus Omnitrophota bacterium]